MATIKLNHITKVEGHANLTIKVDGGTVEKVQLEVFEGSRLFEALVKGRSFSQEAKQ